MTGSNTDTVLAGLSERFASFRSQFDNDYFVNELDSYFKGSSSGTVEETIAALNAFIQAPMVPLVDHYGNSIPEKEIDALIYKSFRYLV